MRCTNTYDAQDNRTSVTDALGNRTELTYNSQGRVLTVKDARNNVTTNTYDGAGNLLTTTEFRLAEGGGLQPLTDPNGNTLTVKANVGSFSTCIRLNNEVESCSTETRRYRPRPDRPLASRVPLVPARRPCGRRR